MKKYFLVPLLLSAMLCFSQGSKLYDRCGRLIVDSTFQISKKELKKFTAVEDEFIESLGKHLVYNPVLRENEIEFEMFCSFTVDDSGKYGDVKIEKVTNNQVKVNKYLSDWMTVQLMSSTGKFNERFKARKGKTEKYYVPIKFKMDKKADSFGVVSGWILKQQRNLSKIDKGGGIQY